MKKLFISGISSGIGYCTASFLADKGYQIIGTVRSQNDATKCKKELPEHVTPILADLTRTDDVILLRQQIENILDGDKLYAMIHNAGVAVPGALSDLSMEDWDYQMNINVRAVFEVTNALLPFMKLGKSASNEIRHIVHISSVSGLINIPINGAYCISKHALESLSDIYRRELEMFGIRVTSIQPGPIKTPIWKKTKKINLAEKFPFSPYLSYYNKSTEALDEYEQSALHPSKVASVIYDVLRERRTKAKYIVHKHPTPIRLIQWLPARMQDAIIRNQLKKMRK